MGRSADVCVNSLEEGENVPCKASLSNIPRQPSLKLSLLRGMVLMHYYCNRLALTYITQERYYCDASGSFTSVLHVRFVILVPPLNNPVSNIY